MILLMAVFFSNTAFLEKNASIPSEDVSCVVYVKRKGGSAAGGIRVATDVCGGISCDGTRTFYTDNNGKAILKWVKGCKLCAIYVDGKKHEGNYTAGSEYTFTLN